jgi:Flp pilus assembly pilin Flp
MLRNLNAVVAKLHRDERGAGPSVESIIMVGLGVLVLFTVGQLVGVGQEITINNSNSTSLIGQLFNFAVDKIFGVEGSFGGN